MRLVMKFYAKRVARSGLVVAAGFSALACGGSSTTHSGDDGNSPATGGTASGGSEGTGGASGSGGQQAGSGGAGGTGGASSGGTSSGGTSSGGSSASGVIAILGDACSTPAALACAGNYQKVSLLCGASGTWEANETCGDGQFCDSSEGVNAGTCRPVVTECEGFGPGEEFCRDSDVMACGPDLVTDEFRESCSDVGVCEDGACVEKDPCPESGFSCDVDCPPLSGKCVGASLDEIVIIESVSPDYLEENPTIRTPAAARAGTCDGSERRWFRVTPNGTAYRARIGAPWGFVTGTSVAGYCSAPIQEGCMTFGPDQGIVVVAPDSSALPRNILLEPGGACE